MKNAKWLQNGVREIISLYYDDLPTVQYLFTDLSFPKGDRAKVSFRLSRPPAIAVALFRRLQRQFEILELIDRYNTVGAWYVSEVVRESKGRTRAAIENSLDIAIEAQTALFGLNHCKTVVTTALSLSNDFMMIVNAK